MNRIFGRLLAVSRLAMCLCAGAALAVTPAATPTKDAAARSFDLREQYAHAADGSSSLVQNSAIEQLAAAVPELFVDLDPATGATRSLFNRSGYLTGPDARPAREIGLDFVGRNLELLGLTADDFAGYEVTDDVYSAGDGATHLYLRQRHDGLPVYNAQLHININRDGRILSVNNLFLPHLALAANERLPSLNAAEALDAVAFHLGLANAGAAQQLESAPGTQARTRVLVPELSLAPVELALVWLPIRAGEARLMWNFVVETLDGEHWYDINIDAHDGRVWTRFDWVADADYQVYPTPIESPNHAPILPPTDGRTILTDPHNVTASPFGWHDTNGAAGAEFTIMRGNNAHAYQDSDGNDSPPAVQPDCGASLDCEFALNLAAAPSTYQDASIANLFYWNNFIHDVEFFYGFDSPGGNFQVNTYTLGGLGNDDVMAQAQSSGNCNANFGTPVDGQRPRMRMFNCTNSTPAHDGDFDAGVVVHEYGHGISNRLVGGPGNVSCLQNSEQPGEGLSDWWGLSLTMEPTDLATDGRGVGTYLLGQPISGNGVRSQRYSTDPAINTFTYANVNGSTGVHAVGEKWAQAYWEVTWALIAEHGFEPNLFSITHTATDKGNIRAKFYINQGLKNSVCSPGFVDVRNGIIQAATDNYGGEDVCTIWTAFAAYGLGASASQGSSASTTDQVPAFDLPLTCSFGTAGTDARVCSTAGSHIQNVNVGPAYTSPPVDMSVAGNPAGSTAVFSVDPVPTVPANITLTVGNLGAVAAGTYNITVSGDDGVDTSNDIFALTVDVTAAPATTLVTPADDSVDVGVRPTLTWSVVAGALDYLVEVSDDPTFATVDFTTTVPGTSVQVSSSLLPVTHYYWRVSAGNACGRTVSSVFDFITANILSACGGPVTINDNVPATPYPSVATIVGASGAITGVEVSLNGLTHTFPDDLDMLLVAPSGQTFIFMSDAGGSGDVSGLNLTLSDSAATLLSDVGPLAAGNFRPSNVDNTGDGTFAAPAPAGPYSSAAPVGAATFLSAFGAATANGGWQLFLRDDAGQDTGTLTQWCVNLTVATSTLFIDGFGSGNTSAWSATLP